MLLAAFTVTSNADDGTANTLRWAIQQSNAAAGPNTIDFNIAGRTQAQTISLANALGALPPITNSVYIEGLSQSQNIAMVFTPQIEIDGSGVGGVASGLVVNCGNVILQGLAISNFGGNGIELNNPAGSPGDSVYSCNVGSGLSGTQNSGNQKDGIVVTGANNRIGLSFFSPGFSPANVISGNTAYGVHISGTGATNNIVSGNAIGVDATGDARLANGQAGVLIESGASNNHIGDDSQMGFNTQNEISGNIRDGIQINASSNNFVFHNFIGLGIDGSTEIGNGRNGVYVLSGSTNNVIEAGNTISANLGSGVTFSGPDVTGNKIQGSFIGTDPTGTLARGNVQNGVTIDVAASNLIGQGGLGQGNVISGNLGNGISITGTLNTVYGNLIGTEANGTLELPNQLNGVSIAGTNNSIGSSMLMTGNTISGNLLDGVAIAADNNNVVGNYIGTDSTGTEAAGNGGNGVSIVGNNNHIGLATFGGTNVISGNAKDGVLLNGNTNTVAQDWIGVDGFGDAGLENGTSGVEIQGNNNNIGIADATGRNVISGNGYVGISVQGSTNVMLNNYIGVGDDGETKVGNTSAGILISSGNSDGNIIGRAGQWNGNVVSANSSYGIRVTGATGTLIKNNYIGLGADGVTALGNGLSGILVEAGTKDGGGNRTVIGGATTDEENFICNNGTSAAGGFGIDIANNTTVVTVENNWIGLYVDANAFVFEAPNKSGWKQDPNAGNTWTDNWHD